MSQLMWPWLKFLASNFSHIAHKLHTPTIFLSFSCSPSTSKMYVCICVYKLCIYRLTTIFRRVTWFVATGSWVSLLFCLYVISCCCLRFVFVYKWSAFPWNNCATTGLRTMVPVATWKTRMWIFRRLSARPVGYKPPTHTHIYTASFLT